GFAAGGADGPQSWLRRSTDRIRSEFFRGLFRCRKFFFRAGLRGGFRLRRGRPLPRFLRSIGHRARLILPCLSGRLGSRWLRLPRRLHDVLQGLAREGVVEVDPNATCAHRGDDAVLPADRDFHSDLGADFLPQELPFGAELDEAGVTDSGAFFWGDQDLDGLPDLRPDEGGLQAFEQPPAADDDRDLDVYLLLIELALLLRDLIVRR